MPFASAAASCPASPSLLARRSTAPSAPPPCAQSPGVPEESHSAIGSQLAIGGGLNNNNNHSFSSPPSVASSFASSGITTPKTTGRIKIPPNRRKGEYNNNNQHLNNDIKRKEEISATNPSLLHCQFCSEQLPDVQALQVKIKFGKGSSTTLTIFFWQNPPTQTLKSTPANPNP